MHGHLEQHLDLEHLVCRQSLRQQDVLFEQLCTLGDLLHSHDRWPRLVRLVAHHDRGRNRLSSLALQRLLGGAHDHDALLSPGVLSVLLRLMGRGGALLTRRGLLPASLPAGLGLQLGLQHLSEVLSQFRVVSQESLGMAQKSAEAGMWAAHSGASEVSAAAAGAVVCLMGVHAVRAAAAPGASAVAARRALIVAVAALHEHANEGERPATSAAATAREELFLELLEYALGLCALDGPLNFVLELLHRDVLVVEALLDGVQ